MRRQAAGEVVRSTAAEVCRLPPGCRVAIANVMLALYDTAIQAFQMLAIATVGVRVCCDTADVAFLRFPQCYIYIYIMLCHLKLYNTVEKCTCSPDRTATIKSHTPVRFRYMAEGNTRTMIATNMHTHHQPTVKTL